MNCLMFRMAAVDRFELRYLLAGVLISVSAAAAAEQQQEEEKLPDPIEVTDIVTADGVRIAATYYPSNAGKEAVPIVLLHAERGSRRDFRDLAMRLHTLGHAVLVPDLRGHGDSRTRRGAVRPLDPERMGPQEFTNMVFQDMNAVKALLIKENNREKMNIEKLVVIGAELGASVALNWAAYDWSILPVGNKKQGQDIKALVLISPEKSVKGLPINRIASAKPVTTLVFDPQLQRAFKNPELMNFRMPVPLDFRREVSTLIFVGNRDASHRRDAEWLLEVLKEAKRIPGVDQTQKDLFFGEFNTKLQGTRLLGKQLPLEKHIELFINLRAVKRQLPWAIRKAPY